MKKESKIILIISAAVLIVLGGYAYFSNMKISTNKGEAPKDIMNNQTAPTENDVVQNSKNIVIRNFAFEPRSLKVKLNDTVVWSNEDSMPHTIKIGDIASPEIKTNDTFRYKFEKIGTFPYSCGIHPRMKGEIIVE